MVHGAWCVVDGAWGGAHGPWCGAQCAARCVVRGARCVVRNAVRCVVMYGAVLWCGELGWVGFGWSVCVCVCQNRHEGSKTVVGPFAFSSNQAEKGNLEQQMPMYHPGLVLDRSSFNQVSTCLNISFYHQSSDGFPFNTSATAIHATYHVARANGLNLPTRGCSVDPGFSGESSLSEGNTLKINQVDPPAPRLGFANLPTHSPSSWRCFSFRLAQGVSTSLWASPTGSAFESWDTQPLHMSASCLAYRDAPPQI